MNAQDVSSTVEKLQDERERLEERLHLLESEQVANSEGGSHTDTPSSVRDQIAQVDRLIEQQQAGD